MAFTFWVQETRPDFLNFWLFGLSKEGRGGGKRHSGALKTIRDVGFVIEQDIVESRAKLTLGVSDDWLAQHRLDPATPTSIVPGPGVERGLTDILLLRRLS